MNGKKLLELLKCFDEDGEIMVTSNPACNSYSYPYTRFFIDTENKLNIEFSEKIAMPSVLNKNIIDFLTNHSINTVIVRNIDNDKNYDIIDVGGDEDEDMGNDIYIFINDETD